MTRSLTRRSFLRGIGGAAAASSLPFLPSLTSEAVAQGHSYSRVIFVAWSHGVAPQLWQPSVPGFSDVAPGVRSARMRDATKGLYMGNYFDGLEDKITMIRGLGQVGAWGHQTSVALTASERGEDQNYRITGTAPMSIDNVLARSSQVYPSAPAVDVLRLSMGGLEETHSYIDYNWVAAVDAQVAFARMFADGFPDANEPAPVGPSEAELALRRRALVAERTLTRYRGLLDSGRLSVADRLRVEDAMQRYAELSASLQAQLSGNMMAPMPVAQTCNPFSVSGSDDSEQKMRDHIQLFCQGLACGATRIGYWKLNSSHADVDGAHQAASSANLQPNGLYTRIMRENCRWISELLRAMDSITEANGNTLLDNSLVVVTSDMATSVIGEHPGVDAPFMLAGGLGGRFRMGEVIDYADYGALLTSSHGHDWYAGPPHNELLISIMKAFGLQGTDWGGSGFGQYECVRDNICRDPSPYVTQRKYVDYYHNVHAGRRSPGAELPYLRLA